MRRVLTASLLGLALSTGLAHADAIKIVAAENFYGDVARQVGGDDVAITSILSNPDQDPHLFEASASTARAIADARFVIYNGIDYDPWVEKLLAAARAGARRVIVVAALMHRKDGDNPHLWYDPATMPAVAKALAAALAATDPRHGADYRRRLAAFLASMQPMSAKIAAIRGRYANTPVAATEPVFGYMAEALGLAMHGGALQLAVMNDTEPSARDIAAFEHDLAAHRVKVLFYNDQTTGGVTERLQSEARSSGVPIVGVSETEPPNSTYQDWMMSQLEATERALSTAKP